MGPDIHFALGRLLDENGDLEAALPPYVRGLCRFTDEKDPEDDDYLEYLVIRRKIHEATEF